MRAGRLALPLVLPLVLALLPGAAGASGAGCGGNANTFAEVVEGSRGRGPVVVRPDSLCADLAETRPPASVPIDVHVGVPAPGQEAGGEAVPPTNRRR